MPKNIVTTRIFRRSEQIVDDDFIDWMAHIDSTGDVRWYCDEVLTGEEIEQSPERVAQIIAEILNDGYREA